MKAEYDNSYIGLYDQEALVYPCKIKFNGDLMEMETEYELDEYFYAFDCKNNRKKYFNRFYQFSPLIDGALYQVNIDQERIFGLIPMKPENDFNHLTYYTKEIDGLYSASILNCDKYPLCTFNETIEKPLLYYNSSSIIYNSNEYKDISPISKNQKILILRNKREIVGPCIIFANM